MTAVPRTGAPHPRPRIRLAPAPRTAPPFDDEVERPPVRPTEPRCPPVAPVPVQGSLALEFALPSGVPAVPAPPPRLRIVGSELARSGHRAVGDEATRPDVARWAAMVVQAAVEVVAGDRPLTQMVRWTTAEVYDQLRWRRQRQIGGSAASVAVAPRRAVVSSVHVCQPDDDVAEACATVRVGGRATAVALRLEADRDSWRCTAIALG